MSPDNGTTGRPQWKVPGLTTSPAFLSAGPKAAAFEPAADRWTPAVWGVALATMVVGNFAALAQTNLKRLLAVMYVREPAETAADLPPLAGGLGVTVWSAVLATLVLGVCPGLVLDFAGRVALR